MGWNKKISLWDAKTGKHLKTHEALSLFTDPQAAVSDIRMYGVRHAIKAISMSNSAVGKRRLSEFATHPLAAVKETAAEF